jgi:hypothetical protein
VPELASAEAVLAPWSLGHFITYYGEMPVVANNFFYGFFDSLRFFLADDEDQALAVARARRVRWILATDLAPKMNDYAAVLGRDPLLVSTPQGTGFSPAYFRTLQSRLYDFDGAGAVLPDGKRVEPLLHFSEVYASRTGIRRFGRFLARWKVFEIR